MLSGNQVVTQFQSFTPTGCYRATINPQTDLANFRSYAVKPNNLTAQPSNNYLQFK
jgi:hypothetical protein